MNFFIFFSISLFLFPLFSWGESQQRSWQDIPLFECCHEKSDAPGQCTNETRYDRPLRWEIYRWTQVDVNGVVSIFTRGIGDDRVFRYIADGKEHKAPHSDAWGYGVKDKTYLVTSHTEEETLMTIKGFYHGTPFHIMHETRTKSATGKISIFITFGTSNMPPRNSICTPLNKFFMAPDDDLFFDFRKKEHDL